MSYVNEQRITRNDFRADPERTLLIKCFSATIKLTPDSPRSEACACLEMLGDVTDESFLASINPLEARALADALNLLADEYDAFCVGEGKS